MVAWCDVTRCGGGVFIVPTLETIKCITTTQRGFRLVETLSLHTHPWVPRTYRENNVIMSIILTH